MANNYMYNNYQQYSPPLGEGQMNTSPIFHNMPFSGNGGLSSASSTTSSVNSNYSLHNPRLRYYLSKLFDAEDDLEFCPEIPEFSNTSPTIKKFNPYTASVFSPTAHAGEAPVAAPLSPRTNTPRLKKPIEIVNPHTKMRVGSPSVHR